MATLIFKEAAAATAAGTRITEANGLDAVPYPRVIDKIAVTGSSAAGTGSFDLFVGQTFIGTYTVTSTGLAPVEAKDYKVVNVGVYPNETIVIKIRVAGATNVMQAEVWTSP